MLSEIWNDTMLKFFHLATSKNEKEQITSQRMQNHGTSLGGVCLTEQPVAHLSSHLDSSILQKMNIYIEEHVSGYVLLLDQSWHAQNDNMNCFEKLDSIWRTRHWCQHRFTYFFLKTTMTSIRDFTLPVFNSVYVHGITYTELNTGNKHRIKYRYLQICCLCILYLCIFTYMCAFMCVCV